MSLELSIAVVGLFLIMGAVAWPAMYAIWSRGAPDARDLNLWRVARRRGLARNDLASEPELSRAVYRCIACTEAGRCDRVLAAGGDREIDAFCANRVYLARLAERHRRS